MNSLMKPLPEKIIEKIKSKGMEYKEFKISTYEFNLFCIITLLPFITYVKKINFNNNYSM
jgi:hypothetical protein